MGITYWPSWIIISKLAKYLAIYSILEIQDNINTIKMCMVVFWSNRINSHHFNMYNEYTNYA